jgi:hypothetical protein
MESQHPVLTQLNTEIQELKSEIFFLRSEKNRILENYSNDVENVRLILLDALSIEQEGNVDVSILANSIADVFAISLLKSITVSIPITVEATMLVPADFDIDDLQITDVGMDAFNTEVEDFSVESWDMGTIEEI